VDYSYSYLLPKYSSRDYEKDDPDAPHSLLELEGLGAELWQGRDAQEYVNELRDEWNYPP